MAEMHPLRSDDQIPSEIFSCLNQDAEKLAQSCEHATVPSLDHLRMSDYNVVYEPSDDTFLMLDALAHEYDNDNLKRMKKIKYVLELGCGTGVSTIFLGMLMKKAKLGPKVGARLFATDINQDALRVTRQTAEANEILDILETHQCDLATPLLEELEHKCDIIIFNPPYVPTPDDEVGSDGIEASWAGGKDGRVVFDRAVPQIARLLSWPHGTAYIIAVDDNKPEEIASLMMREYGIIVKPFFRRRARNEFLSVLKCTLSRKL